MLPLSRVLALILLALPMLAGASDAEPTPGEPLFDGKTFEGWEGNLDWFRIEDGVIIGGSLEKEIPNNEFLCTTKSYGDFELTLEVQLSDTPQANAGIQFCTARIPNHHEVSGYQADMGEGWWGCLYDESRRNKVLAKPDKAALKAALRPGEWMTYRIRCEGPRIQLWLNGVQTVDYTETEEGIARSGVIGLQIHSGPATEARYRNIRLRELSGD